MADARSRKSPRHRVRWHPRRDDRAGLAVCAASRASRSPRRRSATCAGARRSRLTPWAGVRPAHQFGPRAMQLPVFGDMNFRSQRHERGLPVPQRLGARRAGRGAAAGAGLFLRRRQRRRRRLGAALRRHAPGAARHHHPHASTTG